MGCLSDNQLGALLDGALPDSAPEWAHVAECAGCAELVASLTEQSVDVGRRPAPTPLASLDGRRWAERFDIERRLGSGRRSVTFAAVDRASGQPVALQVLGPAGDGAWAPAAHRLLTFRHPSVCGVHAYGVAAGRAWVAVDLLPEARPLGPGALGWEQAWPHLREVLAALEAAHAAGLTHGALSSSSLLLAGDGRVRLTDLALASAPAPAPRARVVVPRAALLDDASDARAFCRVLQAWVAGAAPPAVPPHLAHAVEVGLGAGFSSLGALRRALTA